MNDLNQINKANQASVTNSAIQAARAAGKFVVAKYDGLHLVGHTECATGVEANSTKSTLDRGAVADENFKLLAPTAVPAHA